MVFIKVKFDGEVSDPFYQGQTFVVTDGVNTTIGSFDAYTGIRLYETGS